MPENNEPQFESFSFTQSAPIKIKAFVNDSIEGLFVLDNGSSTCTLDSAFFYDNFDTSQYKIWKKHRSLWFEYGIGDIKFSIGDHVFSTQHSFTIKNLHEQGRAGIIGIEAFQDKVTVINFDENRIAFLDSFTIPSDYHKIRLYSPHPDTMKYLKHSKYIEVSGFKDIKNEELTGQFLFDLGSSGGGLSSTHKFFKKIQKDTSKITMGYSKLVQSQSKFNNQTYYMDSLYFDSQIKLCDVPIAIKFHPNDRAYDPLDQLKYGDGLLGLKILSQFNLIYDAPNDLLYVKPNKNYFEKSNRDSILSRQKL
ncbi:hypothetical protein FACS1894201_07700 [Bacteroidia bacterium]|nr:hypothetical protein FACS1894201_07700 [Bacteroidia bacterium]